MSAHRYAWGLGSGLLSCSLLACAAELPGSGSESPEASDASASAPLDGGEATPSPSAQEDGAAADGGALPDLAALDGSQPAAPDAGLPLDAARDVSDVGPPDARTVEADPDAATD